MLQGLQAVLALFLAFVISFREHVFFVRSGALTDWNDAGSVGRPGSKGSNLS